MTWELKRVDPIRAANICALVYGILTTVFAVLLAPFALLMAVISPDPEVAWVMLPMLIVYPIIGLVAGWISGLISAAGYNLVIRLTGGLLFAVETRETIPPVALAS